MSPPQLTQPKPAEPESIFDILNIVAKVATVGGSILTQILNAAGKQVSTLSPYRLGNVEWMGWPEQPQYVSAYNNGPQDVLLNYATVRDDGVALSVAQPLYAQDYYDAAQDLKDFAQGSLQIVPVQEVTAPGATLVRALGFAIATLAIGTVVSLTGGMTMGIRRPQPGNYEVYLRANQPIETVHGTFELGSGGLRLSFGGASRAPQAASSEFYEYVWDVPSNQDLGDALDFFQANLDMPAAAFEAATRERKAKTMRGPPKRR